MELPKPTPTKDVLEPSNPTSSSNNNTEESFTSVFDDAYDSNCSTPYVSAPSSPGRGPPVSGFFYSAPASPLHFAITAASSSYQANHSSSSSSVPMGYEFEFSAHFGSSGPTGPGSMSSADELFLNGQIRPMKLSCHLERPQVLAPLLDLDEEEENEENSDEVAEAKLVVVRGRDLRLRDKSLRRRTRSMSPLRSNAHMEWAEIEEDNGPSEPEKSPRRNQNNNENINKDSNGSLETESNNMEGSGSGSGLEATPSVSGSGLGSGSSSRSSSAGRSSKRWVFLKDFLRSKSEGRSNNKFWSTITFSPTKEKKPNLSNNGNNSSSSETQRSWAKRVTGKPTNGVVGKRRVPPSPHELHYKANRAQAEELRKKTFLPYRQGLLGCLGFSSKGYGAMNGFARALNPVSSR
ncbi:uncharacterized protein LOC130947349 [Arachis stenosperma]|uniref:uncharacterized protein LOC130947349 n=1 Tax=Arachis stenosperma TaxID=217475 RepID=UPI0025AC3B34|nr:uncharacterized protein LOC130947349 [Arachis stenosperma]